VGGGLFDANGVKIGGLRYPHNYFKKIISKKRNDFVLFVLFI
jgi:hypothetical protein